jgi:hypothetical protein
MVGCIYGSRLLNASWVCAWPPRPFNGDWLHGWLHLCICMVGCIFTSMPWHG